MSYKQQSPLPIVEGGTGTQLFEGGVGTSGYGVILSGLFSTNPLEVIQNTGSLGQVLMSNGTGDRPTFEDISTTGAVIQIDTDSGNALPVSGIINLITNVSTLNSGSTVLFTGSSNTVQFNVSDINENTVIGQFAGNATLIVSGALGNTVLGVESGQDLTSATNNVLIGNSCGGNITSGDTNTFVGQGVGFTLTTGTNNTMIGNIAGINLASGNSNTFLGTNTGSNYTTNESSNICIGFSTAGTLGESNTLRIGSGTGVASSQIAQTFISGIDGVNVGSVATVVTELGNQLGTAVITAGTGITVTPGANLITIATTGAVSNSFPTDSGTATPALGVLNIIAGNATGNSGRSVKFTGSGNTVTLNVTDASNNTLIGAVAGNASLTGISNTAIGEGAASSNTLGSYNTIVGAQAGHWLSGATPLYNILIGFSAGISYDAGAGESNNIIIGASGTVGESNVLRIGNGTGLGPQQLNKAFISGIDGRNVGSVATVVTEANDQLGTAVITAGTGITITPGANLITIATASSVSTSFPTDSGTATPALGILNILANNTTKVSGSSVTFSASANTIQLNVTDASNNTMIGLSAGNNAVTGTNNTSLGRGATQRIGSGTSNVAIGDSAGYWLQTGSNNILMGQSAGIQLLTSESNCTLIGDGGFTGCNQLFVMTSGSGGTRFIHNYPGVNASTSNGGNTFVGGNAGNFSLAGAPGDAGNAGFGAAALTGLTTGYRNMGIGAFSLASLTTGGNNSAMGNSSANNLVSGSYNLILGYAAGTNYTTSESNNIILGTVSGTIGESNILRIGDSTGAGTGQLNKSFIAGIRGVTPDAADGIPVYISSTGQLGTVGTAAASITSITGDTGGAQSGPAITFAGGTTGLSFGGAANTITTTFAGITANGGTVSLATDATTSTVNVGTGAGAKTVTLGSTTSTSSLALKYGTSDFTLASATGTTISVLDSGEVTMPLQPAFSAYLTTTVSDVTGDGTLYTVIFDTEIYDQGSDFTLGTSTFTAPVTGRYHFGYSLYPKDLSASFTNGYILLVTSNRTYFTCQGNYGAMQSGVTVAIGNNVYADMDLGDTTTLAIHVSGSTKIIDITGTDISVQVASFFSGVLVV